MNVYSESWKGKASLAAAFWIVYIVSGFLLGTVLSFIIAKASPAVSLSFRQGLMLALLLPYTLFATICVWRCGKNSWVGWSILSKIVVIIGLFNGLYALIDLFR